MRKGQRHNAPLNLHAQEKQHQADGGHDVRIQHGQVIDHDDQTPFVSTKAKVVTLNVTALEDIVGTGKIYGIGVSNTSSVSLDLGNIDDYEYGVNLASGINDIKAADATAPAYNLQGVRVNSAAKGVIIRDGKKMVVK